MARGRPFPRRRWRPQERDAWVSRMRGVWQLLLPEPIRSGSTVGKALRMCPGRGGEIAFLDDRQSPSPRAELDSSAPHLPRIADLGRIGPHPLGLRVGIARIER